MNTIKHFQQSMNQPGMVANPAARGQLNKEDNSFLVSVRWYHDKTGIIIGYLFPFTSTVLPICL